MELDPVRFARAVVEKVKATLAPMEARLVALEQRAAVPGPPGRDGVDGKAGEKGDPGESIAGPQGMPGRDADPAEILELKAKIDALSVELATRPPLAVIAELVASEVKAAIAQIATPVDGKNGLDGKDGRDGIDGKDGAPGLNGKDGADGTAGRDGADGLHGKDGAAGLNGTDGRDGLPGVPGRDGERGEKGLDGRDGVDGLHGKDGLGFDDLEPVYDEQGRLTLRFVRGTIIKDIRVPSFVDCGVYKDGTAYQAGDGVTWAGSFWIAREATSAKPGEPSALSRAWRLAVKAGREGKAGANGKDGINGRDGKDAKAKW